MCRISQIAFSIVAATALVVPVPVADPPATQLLEKAIYQEQTVGDLKAALHIFKQIVENHKQNEKVAAQAQLHIGLIHLKLGDREQAADAIQGLADQYPRQQNLLKQRRLAMPPVIDETIGHIRENYVDEIVDDSELTAAALRGVVGNLDAHSAYIDAGALKDLRVDTSGRLIGIGAVLDTSEGRLVVKSPLPGSPARESGLAAGDTIVSIDGVKVLEVGDENVLSDSVKRIRGKVVTVVTLEIISADSDDAKSVEVTRREVKLDSVIGMLSDENDVWQFHLTDDPKIGYVRIWGFTKGTPNDFVVS